MDNNFGYVDLNNFKMYVDGKKVFDRSKNYFVEEVTNCNWLLKKLFKVMHIHFDNSEGIYLFPKDKRSWILWNLLGYEWKISNRGITISGKMKFEGYEKRYCLMRTRPIKKYDGEYTLE